MTPSGFSPANCVHEEGPCREPESQMFCMFELNILNSELLGPLADEHVFYQRVGSDSAMCFFLRGCIQAAVRSYSEVGDLKPHEGIIWYPQVLKATALSPADIGQLMGKPKKRIEDGCSTKRTRPPAYDLSNSTNRFMRWVTLGALFSSSRPIPLYRP